MCVVRRVAFVVLVATLFHALAAGSAWASQTVRVSLEQALDPATRVFSARVRSVEEKRSPQEIVHLYTFDDARALRGSVPTEARARFGEVVPLIYGPDGAVTGWFSPIVEGSGEEGRVVQGKRYVFLTRGAVVEGALVVHRVEPAERAPAVRAAIAKLPAWKDPRPDLMPVAPSSTTALPAGSTSVTDAASASSAAVPDGASPASSSSSAPSVAPVVVASPAPVPTADPPPSASAPKSGCSTVAASPPAATNAATIAVLASLAVLALLAAARRARRGHADPGRG